MVAPAIRPNRASLPSGANLLCGSAGTIVANKFGIECPGLRFYHWRLTGQWLSENRSGVVDLTG
jgi:hypothetical protein